MVKSGVIYTFEVEMNGNSIKRIEINPRKFVEDLENHFSDYIRELENVSEEDEIRKNFEKIFPELNGKFETIIREFSGVELR